MVHHSFASAITNIINIGMIFAPCIGYMTQALKFKNKKSSTGFSLCICLVLIISNVLRIYFWFGRQFTVVLLFQSLIVILSQMYLIKVYLDYKEFHIVRIGFTWRGMFSAQLVLTMLSKSQKKGFYSSNIWKELDEKYTKK